jgi:hypothetical protein
VRALSAADLLDVWEQGCAAHPLARPLLVLAASFPEVGAADLAEENLGSVNARLWAVRAALVGTDVVGCASCTRCGVQAEFEFDATGLARRAAARAGGPVRALTLADLFAAAESADAAEMLIMRCTQRDGCEPTLADNVDVSAELAAADPAAEVLLALACPACGHEWSAPLDIGSFLWTELTRIVGDTVADVDVLARCYGWTERDVLDLSPARRRRYVELATGAAVTAG